MSQSPRFIQISLYLIFASVLLSGVCIAQEPQHPWGSIENGELTTDISLEFADKELKLTAGYDFTPQVDGVITELAGFYKGQKKVKLWNKNSGELLVKASVKSDNSWSYVSIDPVTVKAGETYTVAAHLGAHGASLRGEIEPFPRLSGDILIEASTFSIGKEKPTQYVTKFMLGMVDVSFVPSSITPTSIPLQPAQGEPLAGLTASQLERFFKGKEAFMLDIQSVQDSQGSSPLGPLSNSNSCASCHSSMGLIGGSQTGATFSVTRFGRWEDSMFDPLLELGGSVKHQRVTGNCSEELGIWEEIIPSEANVTATRATPPVFGSGLVEVLRDEDILANAGKPVTGGKAHMVRPIGQADSAEVVGRFGWKAQLATTLGFSADAAFVELGITNRFFPEENQPNLPAGAGPCTDNIPDPDDEHAFGGTFIDELADFQRYLAPPPQMPRSGMTGEKLFSNIGCADCHTPSFTTPVVAGESALSNREIKPYSDFLLHDMGSFGDGIVQGDADGNMMRTPPLWDFRNRLLYMHDGSLFATQPQEDPSFIDPSRFAPVIEKHEPSPEANASALAYYTLSLEQKQQLIRFLHSLGRREFENVVGFITNGLNEGSDFAFFMSCFFDTNPISPDSECALSDVNADGDVDDYDFSALQQVFNGPINDCQCNGEIDLVEILKGGASDSDNNASPDSCNLTRKLAADIRSETETGLNIYLMASHALQVGDEFEIFYSFSGQGQGPSYGSLSCLNISNPVSLVGKRTFSEWGDANFEINITVPEGATQLVLQLAVEGDGTNSTRSNVLTIDLTDPDLTGGG